jgi:tetratricopeptide (TPR) repeat protein
LLYSLRQLSVSPRHCIAQGHVSETLQQDGRFCRDPCTHDVRSTRDCIGPTGRHQGDRQGLQDHYARGNYSAAQIDAQELERLAKARFGADHPDYAIALNKLALVYRAQGKYGEAEGLLKRALVIRERALGANHSDVGQTLHNLALVYRDQGKHGEAEGSNKRALAIREKALGTSHLDVAVRRQHS